MFYKTPGGYKFEEVCESEAAVMQWLIRETRTDINSEQKNYATMWHILHIERDYVEM
jgi:hypothetical protein